MIDERDAVQLWRNEYRKEGIPSSFRDEPSGSVAEFTDFLAGRHVCAGTALDLGCGTGRNSLFLARRGFDVHSIELVPELIDALRVQAGSLGLAAQLQVHCQSVADPWLVRSCSIDVAIDTFCYKHQVTSEGKAAYRRELARVMKPGGFYLLTLAGVDDGYYGPLLSTSPRPDDRLIIDPENGIASILYSKEDVNAEFGGDFAMVSYSHKAKSGLMHGKKYLRSTHVMVFQHR